MNRIYTGRPLPRRTREELMATVRPDWQKTIGAVRAGKFNQAVAAEPVLARD
jgi:hypothetical protein